MMRQGLTDKVTFEQRLKGGKGGGHMRALGKSVLGRMDSQCKGPRQGPASNG